MDIWEVWYIEKTGKSKKDKFLSSHDSLDISEDDDLCPSRERCVDDSAATSPQLYASKHDISHSEDGGLFSSCSNSSSTALRGERGSRKRMNSLSSYEDSIGLSSSYTLEEPGKEKRHVLVMDSLRKCESTGALKTRSNTSPVLYCQNKDIQDTYPCVNGFNNNNDASYQCGNESLPDKRHSSYHNTELHRNSGEQHNESFDSVLLYDSLNCNALDDSTTHKPEKGHVNSGELNCYSSKERYFSSTDSCEHCNYERGRGSNKKSDGRTIRNKRCLNKSSSEESNTSLSRSYTLDEPGKEKRHVYVLKSRSSTSVDTCANNSLERDVKSNTSNTLSESLKVVRDDGYDNKNNICTEQINRVEGNAIRKKSKSILSKAKKFFKSPLKLSSKLNKFGGRSRENENSSSDEDRRGLTNDVKVSTSATTKSSSSSEVAKTPNTSGEHSLKARAIKASDKEGRSQLDNNCAPFRFKKKAESMTDKNENEEEYEIINIVDHITKPSSNFRDRRMNKDTDLHYDISFKPEGSPESDRQQSRSKPLRKRPTSLIIDIGRDDNDEETSNIPNIVRPHSVEERGCFRLGRAAERMNSPRTEVRNNERRASLHESDYGLLHTSGLLFGRSAKSIPQTKPDTDDSRENAMIKWGGDYTNDSVAHDFDVDQLITSTPIKRQSYATEKYPVTDGFCSFDYDENNGNEMDDGLPVGVNTIDDKGALRDTQHVHNLKFDSFSCDDLSLNDVEYADDDSSSSSSLNTTSGGYTDDYDVTGSGSDRMSSMSDDSLATHDNDMDNLIKHLEKLGESEKDITANEIDQIEELLTRRLSTDSLNSFEYHEREFTNNSMSPLYPLSPTTVSRSPKKTFSNVSELPEQPADTFDYDEWFIAAVDDISERRMTFDLLNYMPPIEEGCESACLTEDEQVEEATPFSPPECNQVRRKPIEKVSDKPRLPEENEGEGRQDVDTRPSDEQVNLEMGAEASKIGSKAKNKGSSRKNLKSKKKKEKQRIEDDGELSQSSTPEKIWIHEPKGADEYVTLDKNENVEVGVVTNDNVANDISPVEAVHVYNEDPEFSLKNTEQPEESNINVKVTPSDSWKTNASNAAVPFSSESANNLSSTSLKSNGLVFEIPIDNDQSSFGSNGLDGVTGKGTSSALSDIPNNNGTIETVDAPPKKCLWYDYSKDEKTATSEREREDLSKSFDSVWHRVCSGDNADVGNASFENRQQRSHSFGSSRVSNDIDLNDLIESIIEKNNEVIESMKARELSKPDKRSNPERLTENANKGESKQLSTDEEHLLVDRRLTWECESVSTEGGDEEEESDHTYHTISVNSDCSVGIPGKDAYGTYDALPEMVVTQASLEITESLESDSGVEHSEFLSKIDAMSLEEEDDGEEGDDSGTELRYDDFLTNECSGTDSDYRKWVDSIKPLLHDAELVANLYIRLANKYAKYSSVRNEVETRLNHLHSAQIAYDVIKQSNLTNFSSVITYLLSYLGAIKSEKPVPENISIPNLLSFLEEIIKRNTMTSHHVTMFTCFLARPNKTLTEHHKLRLAFLLTCFKQEISQLNVNTEELLYLRTCFMKISEYFIQLDMKLANNLTNEYLLPHITDQNSTSFIMDALTYMGLVKSEEPVITTSDITSALILLDIIFLSKKMSLLTSQKLYAFIQLNNPKFRFCAAEREAVTETLKKAIDF